jgi:hypothetical protein
LTAKRVEIETASLKLGGQVAAEWLPMIGLSYDPKDDLIEIALEGTGRVRCGSKASGPTSRASKLSMPRRCGRSSCSAIR